ncbi:MAG: hypothetical protein ACRENY_09720 [Candidatus Dormibacteria bacterium]
MVSVFGTMAADGLHYELGIPYPISTAFYVVVLIAVLAAWYARQGTLSVHSIYTRERELFYWAAVLAAFALGTAAGDFTSYTLQLGFFTSAWLFSVLFLLPGAARWLLRLNSVATFWVAYTLTHPVGGILRGLDGSAPRLWRRQLGAGSGGPGPRGADGAAGRLPDDFPQGPQRYCRHLGDSAGEPPTRRPKR